MNSPFNGAQGQWLKNTLAHRADKVRKCLEQGEPEFELVHPPGYRNACLRCKRCLTIKRFHG